MRLPFISDFIYFRRQTIVIYRQNIECDGQNALVLVPRLTAVAPDRAQPVS